MEDENKIDLESITDGSALMRLMQNRRRNGPGVKTVAGVILVNAQLDDIDEVAECKPKANIMNAGQRMREEQQRQANETMNAFSLLEKRAK